MTVLTVRTSPRTSLGTLVRIALSMPIRIPPILGNSSFTLPVVIHHWPRELLRVHVLILLLLLISTMSLVGIVIRFVPRADQTLNRRASGRHMEMRMGE